MVEVYVGLDVSDTSTHICAVDFAGTIVWQGVCASDPAALAQLLQRRFPGLKRVVLETGPLSVFLVHGWFRCGGFGDSLLNP